MRLLPLALLFSLLITAAGCGSSTSDNAASNTSAATATGNSNVNSSNDNVDELGMMIKLPFVPEEVAWRETPFSQTDRKLIAVLLYSNEDAAKFTSQLAAQGKGKPDEVSVEEWFPAELQSQSDLSGESTLKGQSYNAGELLQPPYTAGTVTRISDSNYFVVQLATK
jgi:hypothetical protein